MKISFYSRRLLGAVIVKNKLDRLWRTSPRLTLGEGYEREGNGDRERERERVGTKE